MSESDYLRGQELMKPIVIKGLLTKGKPMSYLLGDGYKAIQSMNRGDLEILALHAIAAFMKGADEELRSSGNGCSSPSHLKEDG